MTDTSTNPETGVEGSGDDALTDDIDTEAFDRAPAPDDEDAEQPGAEKAEGEEGEDADPDKAAAKDADPELVEVERNGTKYKVPKALHGELLMQADYTAKTTDLAQKAKTLAEERTTWESQREQSRAALPEEHRKVALLERDVETVSRSLERVVDATGLKLKEVNWIGFRQEAARDPELKPHYDALWNEYEAGKQALTQLNDELGTAKTELQTKEAKRLEEQQGAAKADLAKRQEETGKALVAEIPGFKEKAEGIARFMVEECGVSPEELAEATDARLWKLAHRAIAAEAEVASLKKTQKQQETATNHEKAQATTPAATPKGGGGASQRDPSTARGDGLSTPNWMERRNAQLAKKRA